MQAIRRGYLLFLARGRRPNLNSFLARQRFTRTRIALLQTHLEPIVEQRDVLKLGLDVGIVHDVAAFQNDAAIHKVQRLLCARASSNSASPSSLTM